MVYSRHNKKDFLEYPSSSALSNLGKHFRSLLRGQLVLLLEIPQRPENRRPTRSGLNWINLCRFRHHRRRTCGVNIAGWDVCGRGGRDTRAGPRFRGTSCRERWGRASVDYISVVVVVREGGDVGRDCDGEAVGVAWGWLVVLESQKVASELYAFHPSIHYFNVLHTIQQTSKWYLIVKFLISFLCIIHCKRNHFFLSTFPRLRRPRREND